MGLSPKNTPRTPYYLLPLVAALALTGCFLYNVTLFPSLLYLIVAFHQAGALRFMFYLLIVFFFPAFHRTGRQLHFQNQNRRGPQLKPNAVAPFRTQDLQ